jgi:hypothetical protein
LPGNLPYCQIKNSILNNLCQINYFFLLNGDAALHQRKLGSAPYSQTLIPAFDKNLDRPPQLCDIFISLGDSREKFRLSPGKPDEPEPAALTNTFEAIKCIWRNAVGYGRCFFYDILELWR